MPSSPVANEWLTDRDLRTQFNAVKWELYPWSVDLSQNVSKNTIIHLGRRLSAWGAYRKTLKFGQRPCQVAFPRYRKRGRHMSFTPSNGRNTVRVAHLWVKLSGIGWMRIREPLRFDGDILSVTVSLEASRWFVAFQVDTGEPTWAKLAREMVMGLTSSHVRYLHGNRSGSLVRIA